PYSKRSLRCRSLLWTCRSEESILGGINMESEKQFDHATNDDDLKLSKFDSTWTIARKKFVKNKIAMTRLFYLIFIILFSFLGEYIFTGDIERINFKEANLPLTSEH